MSRRYYDLPPFTTLSFKNAARELSVTPGAVSHQIKALEGALGVALFNRQHRGVVLTPEGQTLFATLASTFNQLSRQIVRVRRTADTETVTVGSTTAVAALWLSPAIIDFWRDHPEINVNQITQDRPLDNVRDLDFFILYGPTQNPSLDLIPLYRDQLVPVAAPQLARALDGAGLALLAQQRLVQLDAANTSWTRWPEWFGQLGYRSDLNPGARVTSYFVALQIARKGLGVALGWRRLVQPMIESGKLAIIGPHCVPAPHMFYLAAKPDSALSDNARVLKTWVLETIRTHSD